MKRMLLKIIVHSEEADKASDSSIRADLLDELCQHTINPSELEISITPEKEIHRATAYRQLKSEGRMCDARGNDRWANHTEAMRAIERAAISIRQKSPPGDQKFAAAETIISALNEIKEFEGDNYNG